MSKEAAKCTVCYDPFTKQPHKKQAACPYCDIQACTTCTQTYLINTFEDPHCMGCRKAWSREVLDTILLTTWINGDYKKHRENILLDREKSRLPAAQLMVGLRKRAKELQPVKAQILTEIKEMEKRIAELRDTYLTVERRIQSLMRGQAPEEQTAEKKEEKEHRVFIMPCPAADCRGFLSTAYKCGVCDVYVCPDCREVKGPNRDAAHTCDENTKASVEKLKKETKPCPECGAGIFKIEGCFGANMPILIWDGSTKMSQDICVGDELVGDDGQKRIVERTMTGEDILYEVKQTSGATYVVNSKHMLVLKNMALSENNIVEIPVDIYMDLPASRKEQLVGYRLKSREEPNIHMITKITVSQLEKDTYYGWSVDGNKRFLHNDFTVLRNCDQMYCTACNTPFSWRTGCKVTTGAIHNPHYFEFLRKSNGGVMPRNPGDIPCITNLPGAWTFEREFMRKYDLTGNKECMALYQALNVITHIQHVEIPNNTNRAEDIDNTELNVRYLLQELDEKTWKQQLQQKEKKRIKKDDLRMRFEAFVGACVDIYGTLMNTTRDVHSVKSIFKIYEDKKKRTVQLCQDAYKNLLAMRNIFNESMMDISKRYKCQVLQIGDDFRRSSKKFTMGIKRTKKSAKKAEAIYSDSDSDSEDEPPKNTIVQTA
jgi:hypothetical protein